MSIYIDDTSEQLEQGLLINGELWTEDSIYELQAQIEVLKHNLEGWKLLQKNQAETIEKYQAQVERLLHRNNDLQSANNLSEKCLAEIKVQAITEFGKDIIAHFEGCGYNLTRQTLGWYVNENLRRATKENNQ